MAMTFSDLATQMFAHYNAGQSEQALAVVNQHAGDFPEETSTIRIWQICLQALTGQTKAAKTTLRQALDSGLWYHPEALTGDPDLAALQDDPEFKALLARSASMYEQARRAARPEMSIFAPANLAGPLPLLIALHGMGGNAIQTAAYWQDLSAQGWLVAVPQSSQIVNVGGYVWDDQSLTEQELGAHLAHLHAAYPIDEGRIVLAGFSQGGGLAIYLSLQGILSAIGFIGVAPWLPVVDDLLRGAAPDLTRTPRGVIFTGGQDQPHQAMFEQIEDLFRQRAIPYRRQHTPAVAHAYPPDFAPQRDAALQFILQPEALEQGK